MDLDFISVHKNAAQRSHQYPAISTSRLVNNACEYISYRPIQIKQGKLTVQKCISELGICLKYGSVDFLFPVIWLHKVLTSALITQVYRQNRLHHRVWANDVKRGIDQRSHRFDVCQFDAKSTSVEGFLADASRPTSLANEKTQYAINIGQRILWCNSCHLKISV